MKHRRMGTLLPLFSSLALSSACEFSGTMQQADEAEPPGAIVDAEQSIRAAGAAFSEAFESGDTTSLGELYTEDALLLAPGDTVRGRAAIRRWFRPRDGARRFDHALEVADLHVEGDIAIDRGRWVQTLHDEQADPHTASGVYLVVWRRGIDGRWRMQFDMWHAPYE